MFVKAGILTLKLAFYEILLSIIIGFICTLIKYKRLPLLSPLVSTYIELSRNTPLLIQLFFLYYGLPKLGVQISGFTCAIVGLAFLGGSYMSESFRLGFEAIKNPRSKAR